MYCKKVKGDGREFEDKVSELGKAQGSKTLPRQSPDTPPRYSALV